MPRKSIPAPIQTPATEKQGIGQIFTAPWRKFIQILSDFALSATKIEQTSSGLKYVQNGAIVSVVYSGTGGEIRLPFPPSFPTSFDVWNGSAWSKIDATANPDGTFSVITPNGVGIRMQGAYIFSMSEGG